MHSDDLILISLAASPQPLPGMHHPANRRVAGSLILGSAGMANATEVIRAARELNPRLRVPGRASYPREVGCLKNAGAVYSGEAEVALAVVEDILEALGATPEQIEHERTRAHAISGIPD